MMKKLLNHTRRYTAMLGFACLFLGGLLHAEKENPYAKSDESWISIKGMITSTEPSSFMLDYGNAEVKVEMDDWDKQKEGYNLLVGDEVTVYGAVDKGLFERTTIEAASVFVKGLNTYFYASSADEESIPNFIFDPVLDYDLQLIGKVESVNGREFTIDTGFREMVVDTIAMPYNPMDDSGFQQVEVGDRVSVIGNIDRDWFEGKELEAKSVVTLSSSS